MADERKIKAYVDAEPSISFAGNTDQEILDHLNEASVTRWSTVTSAQIYEATDSSEFASKTAAQKVRVDRILGLAGEIETAPGAKARAELIDIFGGGSQTITNLAAIASESITRGTAAGIGIVRMGEVERARRL